MKAGLSQTALARRADISASLIALLELNRRTPRRDKVEILGRALALPSKKFIGFLGSAGFASGKALGTYERSLVTKALDSLMNDPKISSRQKLEAEKIIEMQIQWLQQKLRKM